jgi:hypothetical protein
VNLQTEKVLSAAIEKLIYKEGDISESISRFRRAKEPQSVASIGNEVGCSVDCI